MKASIISTAILSLLVVAAAASHGAADRQGPGAADESLLRTVSELQKEVRSLRAEMNELLEEAKYDRNEIKFLEQLAQAAEATHGRVRALFEAGRRGGEAGSEAAARYHMHVAKARLAEAKGDWDECRKQHEAAVAAADQQLEAAEAAYEYDKVELGAVFAAQVQRAEANLRLSKIQKKIARRQGR